MHSLFITLETLTLAETYAGKFVVKGTYGKFNAAGADVTINQLQKYASGIIGNTRKKKCVAM